LGLSDEEIKYIDIAGILHDVGKIGIPLEIINKKMRLDDDEYERIKAHPAIGEMMISHIKFLQPVRNVIRHHHERHDGRGYPDGIDGEEISTGARILAVADAYDAMTSDRPYRKALSSHDAFLELRRCSGSQFDPKCVDALGEILEENILYQSAV
jgi:HD-GYP domain-containing protein (c-di-GMP phosphodiesterase class II)